MKARFVDAHCHVQFEQYAHDEAEIVEQMRKDGVVGIVVGVGLDSSEKALALAEKYDHLFASVGLHPNHAEEPFDVEAFHRLASNPRVVAIGECGLDFFRPAEVTDDVKDRQMELLRKHIELAALVDKPLIIHARPSKGTQDAYHDLIAILREAKAKHPALRGDIHFFVGGISEAEELIELGFTVSFTAVITFARDYDNVLRAVPLGSILSETDAPYVAPASRRGQRNDPLAVQDVVAHIASIRGEDPEVVRTALLESALRMFTLPGIDKG
jgi:TatD DNase family protein